MLSRWNSPSETVELDIVTSALVLLSKIGCIMTFFFKGVCQSFSVEAPFLLHALPSQTVFAFLSQRHTLPFHLRHYGLLLAGKASLVRPRPESGQQQTIQPNEKEEEKLRRQ